MNLYDSIIYEAIAGSGGGGGGGDAETLKGVIEGTIVDFVVPSGVTSIKNQLMYGATDLKTLSAPEGFTTIGSSSFSNCKNLQTVDLPSTTTSIGSSAFDTASGLQRFICRATTPPTAGSNFLRSVYSVRIYVPSASVDAYKSATNWSNYSSKIEAIQE